MLNANKNVSTTVLFDSAKIRALLLPAMCWLLLWAPVAQSENTFDIGKAAYQKGDFREAEKIWLELATKGDAQSQFFLGVLYDQGTEAVPKDDEAASTWFEAAARQGHVNAQFNLGNAYKRGRGVTQSEEQAVLWWQKAADLGSPNAQFNLAIQYYQGLGIEKNWDMAVHYFNMAARNGHSKARELIDNKQVPLLEADSQQLARQNVTMPDRAEAPAPMTAPGTATGVNPATEEDKPGPANRSASETGLSPEQWLRAQSPDHYTIQLAASGSKEGVERFIRQHNLTGTTVYLRGSKGGKPLFYLLMGSFPDRHQANLHIESLPGKLRTSKPWARPFADMQALIDS